MWTMSNTDGFAQAELDMINDVRAELIDERHDGDDSDASYIDDAINNAWTPGIDAATLKTRVLARFRLPC